MARIVDLPNENLLQIASHLSAPTLFLSNGPFFLWTQALKEHASTTNAVNKDIKSLIMCCRKLYAGLSQLLYDQIPSLSIPRLQNLERTLQTQPGLARNITFVDVADYDLDLLDHVQFFFWLPSIKSICLTGFCAWRPLGLKSKFGTSPVEKLYLRECGAHDQALTEMFSWPRKLKELWFEWECYRGQNDYLTSRAVASAALVQAENLEKLVITRDGPGESRVRNDSQYTLNGTKLQRLRELCISKHYLVGEYDTSCWDEIPPNIESLEIFYDQYDTLFPSPRPTWLLELLRQKMFGNCAHKLKRLRTMCSKSNFQWNSSSIPYQSSSLTQSIQMYDPVPQDLKDACNSAGVSYSVHVGHDEFHDVRYKMIVEGGLEFEPWDDEKIPDDYVEIRKYPE